MIVSRREFIRQMIALGFSATAASSLFAALSCSPEPVPVPPVLLPPPLPAMPPPVAPPTPTHQSPTGPSSAPQPAPAPPKPSDTYLAVARGDDPKAMVESAIKALGGIERFVKPGNDVIVKPNICVAYHAYEYAATTNPEVVGTLVALCVAFPDIILWLPNKMIK